MFILGVLFSSLAIFFMAALIANFNLSIALQILFDWPTILFFIFIITAVIVSVNGLKTFLVAIKVLLLKKHSISAVENAKAVKLFHLIAKSTVYCSVLLCVIRVMLMLYDLDGLASLGQYIPLALRGILQGVCINLVLVYPAINVLQVRANMVE
ncbi:MAG: hypothetical protein NC238_09975 [Dehalobacter sp.]|nr:hypothetical protein [Dehalobacter sp.]